MWLDIGVMTNMRLLLNLVSLCLVTPTDPASDKHIKETSILSYIPNFEGGGNYRISFNRKHMDMLGE